MTLRRRPATTVPSRAVSSRNSRQALRHRAGPAVADLPAVHPRDGRKFTHRAGAEHLVGAVGLGQRQVDFLVRDGVRAAEFEHRRARDALRAGDQPRRAHKPRSTMNTCVAFVSAMKPRWSSISASSAPATLASILARIDWIRLLWWIFGSRQSGGKRRTLLVTRRGRPSNTRAPCARRARSGSGPGC